MFRAKRNKCRTTDVQRATTFKNKNTWHRSHFRGRYQPARYTFHLFPHARETNGQNGRAARPFVSAGTKVKPIDRDRSVPVKSPIEPADGGSFTRGEVAGATDGNDARDASVPARRTGSHLRAIHVGSDYAHSISVDALCSDAGKEGGGEWGRGGENYYHRLRAHRSTPLLV